MLMISDRLPEELCEATELCVSLNADVIEADLPATDRLAEALFAPKQRSRFTGI
jgi:hypothetical protein